MTDTGKIFLAVAGSVLLLVLCFVFCSSESPPAPAEKAPLMDMR